MARRRIALKLSAVLLVLALGAGGAAVYFWRHGIIQSRTRAWIAREWMKKLAPKIPFTIEDVQIDEDWKDFKEGRIEKLSFTLR
ncbi:MAG: hypothetical protein ACXWP5_16415, partial [Bdellovibrionota bacterium]